MCGPEQTGVHTSAWRIIFAHAEFGAAIAEEVPMTKTAALFAKGGSQAVRLPVDGRSEGEWVCVRGEPRTGDETLSSRPPLAWREFLRLRAELGPLAEAADFLGDRPLNAHGGMRDPFAGSGGSSAP